MGTRRCLMCGSGEVALWLGGAIGTLYHCPECGYVGPVIIGATWVGQNETEFRRLVRSQARQSGLGSY